MTKGHLFCGPMAIQRKTSRYTRMVGTGRNPNIKWACEGSTFIGQVILGHRLGFESLSLRANWSRHPNCNRSHSLFCWAKWKTKWVDRGGHWARSGTWLEKQVGWGTWLIQVGSLVTWQGGKAGLKDWSSQGKQLACQIKTGPTIGTAVVDWFLFQIWISHWDIILSMCNDLRSIIVCGLGRISFIHGSLPQVNFFIRNSSRLLWLWDNFEVSEDPTCHCIALHSVPYHCRLVFGNLSAQYLTRWGVKGKAPPSGKFCTRGKITIK